jgi:hypothetical protein
MEDYEHKTYSLLTPWHLKGRYSVQHNKDYYMRLTKIYFKRFKAPSLLFAGAVLGSCFGIVLAPLLLDGFVPSATAAIPEIPETKVVQAPIELDSDDSFKFGLPDEQKATSVAEVFRGYHVSAYMESARKKIMTISSPDGLTLTTSQVRALGYSARVNDSCQMAITNPVDATDSTVIFASACMPINEADAYNVSDMYGVRKFAG